MLYIPARDCKMYWCVIPKFYKNNLSFADLKPFLVLSLNLDWSVKTFGPSRFRNIMYYLELSFVKARLLDRSNLLGFASHKG